MLGQKLRAAAACLMLVCTLGAPADATAREMTAGELEVVEAINGLRASFGLKRLWPDRRLAAAARAHNDDMLSSGVFAHESSDGLSAFRRVRRFKRADHIGEVLAWKRVNGDTSALAVVLMWMESRAHLLTLADTGFRRIGVARSVGTYAGQQVVMWTADLSSRR